MEKMTFTSDQTAFEYSLYMIISSYFAKAVCKSPLQEKKLGVQYFEQKVNNQYKLEDICIERVERDLIPHLPEEFLDEEVEVYLVGIPEKGITELQFWGKGYILRVYGRYAGRRDTSINYKLWREGDDEEPEYPEEV